MSQLETSALKDVIQDIDPNNAKNIYKRYRSALSAISASQLTMGYDTTNLDRITTDLLSIRTSPQDSTEVQRRKRLVIDLDIELTTISDTLNVPIVYKHNPKEAHEKNDFTRLERAIVKKFKETAKILKDIYGVDLNEAALRKYLLQSAGSGVPQHEVGILKVQKIRNKNNSPVFEWASAISSLKSRTQQNQALDSLVDKYLISYVFIHSRRFFKKPVSVKAEALKKWPFLSTLPLGAPVHSEVQSATADFRSIEANLESIPIFINVEKYLTMYFNTPKANRIDPSEIAVAIQGLCQDACTEDSRNELYSNRHVVYDILNHYCFGQKDKALKSVKFLGERLKLVVNYDWFREQTGITRLSNKHINVLMTTLVSNGVKKDAVFGFAVDKIKKLKALDSREFKDIVRDMSVRSLLEFLVVSMITLKKSSDKKTLDTMKLTMRIEGYLAFILKDSTLKLQKSKIKLKDLSDKLFKYANHVSRAKKAKQKSTARIAAIDKLLKKAKTSKEKTKLKAERAKHVRRIAAKEKYLKTHKTDRFLDRKIANLQLSIAKTHKEIAVAEYNIVFSQVKHEVATSYLAKKSTNPSSPATLAMIKRILKSNDVDKFGTILGETNVPIPYKFSYVQASALKQWQIDTEIRICKRNSENPGVYGSRHRLQVHLDDYYRTGNMDSSVRTLIKQQCELEAKDYEKYLEVIEPDEASAVDDINSYLKQYKNIKAVPNEKAQSVSTHMMGMMMLLARTNQMRTKLLGVYNTYDFVQTSAYFKRGLKESIAKLKARAKVIVKKMNQIGKFLGLKKEVASPDIERASISPFQIPVLKKEFGPIMGVLQDNGNDVKDAGTWVRGSAELFNREQKSAPNYKVILNFDNCIKATKKLRSVLKRSKTSIETSLVKLEKMKDSDGPYRHLPKSMRIKRKQIIAATIANLKLLLSDSKSPYNDKVIDKISAAIKTITRKRKEYIKNKFYTGLAIAAILVVSIGLAMAGGFALGALASAMVGGSTSIAASIFVGGMAIGGMAAGGVVGSRLVMQAFDSAGLVNFGGWSKIWDLKKMGKDFLISYAMIATAMIVARGLVAGATAASRAAEKGTWLMKRYPQFAQRLSVKGDLALIRMSTLALVSNPAGWYSGAATAEAALAGSSASRLTTAAKVFKFEVFQETLQEGSTMLTGNPALEWLLSVFSGFNGIDVRIGLHKIKPADVGLAKEGSNLAYTTRSAEEFVNNLHQQLNAQTGIDYDVNVNEDGTVDLDLLSPMLGTDGNPILDQNGDIKTWKHAAINIKPAQRSENLTPDVELARVKGMDYDPATEAYTITESRNIPAVLNNLRKRGFTATMTDEGLKVEKGDFSQDINIDKKHVEALGKAMDNFHNALESVTSLIGRYMTGEQLSQEDLGRIKFGLQKAFLALVGTGVVIAAISQLGLPFSGHLMANMPTANISGPVMGGIGIGQGLGDLVNWFAANGLEVILYAFEGLIPMYYTYTRFRKGRVLSQQWAIWRTQRNNRAQWDNLNNELNTLQNSDDNALANIGLEIRNDLESRPAHQTIGDILSRAIERTDGMNRTRAALHVQNVVNALRAIAANPDPDSDPHQTARTDINTNLDQLQNIAGVDYRLLRGSAIAAIIWLIYVLLRRKGMLTSEQIGNLWKDERVKKGKDKKKKKDTRKSRPSGPAGKRTYRKITPTPRRATPRGTTPRRTTPRKTTPPATGSMTVRKSMGAPPARTVPTGMSPMASMRPTKKKSVAPPQEFN